MKAHVPKQLLLAAFLFLSAAGFSQNIYISETFPDQTSNSDDDFGDDFTIAQDLGTWTTVTSGDSRIRFENVPYGSGSNYAMSFETQNDGSESATSTSPNISLNSASANACIASLALKFNLYLQSVINNNTTTTLAVDFSSNGGSSWTNAWLKTANDLYDVNNDGTNVWLPITLNIPSSNFTSNFRIRFTLTRASGTEDNSLWVDDIAIADPTIPDFSGTPIETTDAGGAGGGYEVNDVYRYNNVITSPFPIYAEVKIEAVSNAVLENLDNNAAGIAQRFQPLIDPVGQSNGGEDLTADREGYVQFLITFKKASDNSLVNLNGLRYRHFDVDGTSTSSYTFRETGWVTGHGSILVNSPSDIASGGTVVDGGYSWNKALGELSEHTGISSDADVFFTATYGSVSSIRFRLGYIFDELSNATFDPAAREYATEFGCFDIAQNIPLPVKFSYFNANRLSTSTVGVSWTTAMEQNSKGFNVQRNVGGEWKTIGYVPSQALNGSSSSDLKYYFTDPSNKEKGITQYRVQQVDLDGKFAYTDIRAIRGESAASKVVVYPNPSVDGKLNVVFEDNTAVRDVQVADMQGRIVKSFKGITNNILVIEKLTSGFYTIRVTNRNTAATSVEKVVIK